LQFVPDKKTNISGTGGVMGENDGIGGGYGVRSHSGRAANADGRLMMRAIEILKKIVRITLFAMLPWNVYAEAERLPGAQEQLDGLLNAAALVDSPSAAVSFEAPAQEPIPDHQLAMNIPGLNTGGEIPRSEVVSPEPASIVPLDSASLEIVDTGTSKQVQKPQPAAVVSADAESPAALEAGVNISISGETDKLNTTAARVDDYQAINYKVMLPATDVTEKNVMTGAVGAETGNKSGQTEGVSGDAASEEIIRLPYAVLLAILALISMIPISRRNG
jgi:hypothetical protein